MICQDTVSGNIQAKKSVTDSKRGKIFKQSLQESYCCSKRGGGDPTSNFRLRAALDKANAASMCQKLTSRERSSVELVRSRAPMMMFYMKGYAPAGTAVTIEGSPDNRNRTVAESKIFKNGGSMGVVGVVSHGTLQDVGNPGRFRRQRS
ncbi:MAG: YebC/PmpR family DNA-binding transcriptional regulator [Caldisericia bacterium]